MSYFISLLNWLIISGLCEAFKTRDFVIASRRNENAAVIKLAF